MGEPVRQPRAAHGQRAVRLPGLAFPAGTPTFPSRGDFVAYLRRYADVFAVPVETGTAVTRVRPSGGAWTVDTQSDSIHARAVVVATGIVANPFVPAIADRERFRGRVIHSVEYRRPDPFRGRRVLVVGAGNSAGEIAAELADAGTHVTVAVRSGADTVPREIAGVPIQYFSVAVAALPRAVRQLAAAAVGHISSMIRGASPIPGGRPAPCRSVPLVGFHLVDAVTSGRVSLRGGLAAFTAGGVRFSDGVQESFDVVILATGYRAALAMFGGDIRLDECGFGLRSDRVASADHPNLCFVGHNYDARGGLFNIARDAGNAARRITAALSDRGRRSIGTPRPVSETRSGSSRRATAGRDAAPSR